MSGAVAVMSAVPQMSLRRSLERFEFKPANMSYKSAAEKEFDTRAAASMQRNLIVCRHVQSWMEPSISLDPGDILRLFDCIERLVHLMEYSFSAILFPMLIYAERYIKKTRPLKRPELFPMLVVAACLALKMWEDYGPDLDLTVKVCGISKRFISDLERTILETFEYRLLISTEDVEKFKTDPLPTMGSA
eukprot:TRINITY_DN23231_c0_g1_i1.p1 TRINITY_DN23231_c0_g1~~TRINITY_DN23231_c0_g1_i1.p1  ORF type:complete len:190 (-),score=31.63 TRINITY_DN23231_c0_g1_i1:694-1263(-)